MDLNRILDRPYSELNDEEKRLLFAEWYHLPPERQSAYRAGLPEEERRGFDFERFAYFTENPKR